MMNVLAINSGSSSLKFKVVEFDESQKPDARFTMSSRYAGFVEEIGPAAKLMLRLDGKIVVQSTSIVSTHAEADFADLIERAPAAGFVPKSELSAEAIRRLAP